MLPRIDDLAFIDDRVSIKLDGKEIRITESYEVKTSFLTQPSAFSIRIGNGEVTRELLERYPPGTIYALFIADTLQFVGRLDDVSPEGTSGATEVNLKGRDFLAHLHDNHAEADRSFKAVTFEQLTTQCLDAAGITGYALVTSNDAHRMAVTGGASGGTGRQQSLERQGVTVVHAPTATGAIPEASQRELDAVLAEQAKQRAQAEAEAANAVLASVAAAKPPTEKPLMIKVGTTWYAFLKKELDRAGLFLLAGTDNIFILASPNVAQSPMYRVARQRGASRNAVNILSARFRNSTTGRHARYVVYGRGGGEKAGSTKVRGEFIDEEMIGWGFAKVWSNVDDQVRTQAQADYMAKKQCADARRKGWALSYTVQGHTAPVLGAGGQQRAVWAVDTVVDVHDDEYGVYGAHWVEEVSFRRSEAGTTTDLSLMRLEDLVFGEPEGLAAKSRGKRKVFGKET